MVRPIKIASIRPLVRYVDHEQAVVDTHITTLPALPGDTTHRTADHPVVYVMAELEGADGFHDEGCGRLALKHEGDHYEGGFRFGIEQPRRWWPSGMGEQPLYTLSISLIVGDEVADRQDVQIGLASVRRDRVLGSDLPPSLLVNGQICEVVEVLVVDQIDENQLLPANGESLLLVRDHFGEERLYQAADMAGVLAVQAVPIDPLADPMAQVYRQVDRLAGHPSLAGYYVGHLGELSEPVAEKLRVLDPTRAVFTRFPLDGAA
ncbi:MAG: hypothetical protein AAGA29_01480 [Planctomycetota bacterium]